MADDNYQNMWKKIKIFLLTVVPVEGWAKFGVTCVLNGVTPNQYFYKGKEITHKEAIFILLPF